MLVSKCIIWLVVYAVIGWVYESTYCTIVEKKWQNRGFLYGPICPIYGCGAVLMMLGWMRVCDAGITPQPWQVFIVVALVSAVLEYVTSWALEALFHARWWDYTDMPLNLNGRICLPASILFGLMGLLVVYVLYDVTMDATAMVPLVVIECLALLLVCLVTVDTTLTVSALTRFAQICESVSDSVNAHMDSLVGRGMDAAERTMERERFAAAARKAKMIEMGLSVRSAVRRIQSVPAEASSSLREQFSNFLGEIRS